jgi:hypothetical protein
MEEVRAVEHTPPLWESFFMKHRYRNRRVLAVAALVAAIAIALPRFLTHAPYQRLGVRLDWSEKVARVADVIGPPGQGLLQKGDRLIAVEGRPITLEGAMARLRQKTPGFPAEPFELLIERRGVPMSLTVPPLHLNVWQRVRAYALPLVAVVAAPLVAILLVWRRPDLDTAWVFLWFAVLQALGAIWNLFRFPQFPFGTAMKTYLMCYEGLIVWFPASFLHFMTVFPRPRWNVARPTRSAWFWIVVLAYVTPPVLFLLIGVFHQASDRLYLVFQSVALPLASLSLIERYARPSRPDWQPMLRERVIAMAVAVTLLVSTVLDAALQDPRVIAWFSVPMFGLLYTIVVFAWLSSPLLIAYLITNDPVFDTRRLIVRSLPYALLSTVLAALYLAVVIGSQRLFAAATGEEALVFGVVAALFVAFGFAPARDRLQRMLDRLFGRDPQAMRRAFDQAGRDLLSALHRDEVRGAVEGALRHGLRRNVAVEWPEQGMPRLVDPEEVREEDRTAVELLLMQAGIRLENLTLQDQRAAHERNAAELREAATRAELRALQAQVEPHFLFNALNALSYLTETDPKAAQRFTERLADMLRYTVEANSRPAALLSEEIGFVEDYLGVARERYDNPLSFEYHGSRDLLSTAVPPLLLQPLVENSLKHGNAAGTEPLHLCLEAAREDGWITLVFRDDGVANGNGSRGLGTGLQNLEQRVRRFAGGEASMEAVSRNGRGYEVRLRWRTTPNGVRS